VIENIEDRLYRKIKAFIYVTLPKRSTEIAAYFWQSQSFFLTIATEEEGVLAVVLLMVLLRAKTSNNNSYKM
jgi:hypothetical protein